MSTEESTSVMQSHERVGLKRKLTGPPRLLLGKSKNTGQSEDRTDTRALRNQRRVDSNGAPKGCLQEQQRNTATESASQVVALENLQTPSEVETNKNQPDPINEPSISEGTVIEEQSLDGKNKMKKSRAKKSFRHLFSPSCIKPCSTQNDDHAKCEAQITEGNTNTINVQSEKDPFKTHTSMRGRRKFFVRIWPVLRRLLIESNGSQEQRQGHLNQDKDTESENISKKGCLRKKVQGIFTRRKRTPSPVNQFECRETQLSGYEESEGQMNGVRRNHEEMSGHQKEIYLVEERIGDGGGSQTVTVNAEVSVEGVTEVTQEMTTKSTDLDLEVKECHISDRSENVEEQILGTADTIFKPADLLETEESLNGNTNLSLNSQECWTTSSVVIDTAIVELNDERQAESPEIEKKSKTVVIIEDTCPSEEENQSISRIEELDIAGKETLSVCLSVDGLCNLPEANNKNKDPEEITDKTGLLLVDQNSQCAESLLVQTACALVQEAIRCALEQLSVELHGSPRYPRYQDHS